MDDALVPSVNIVDINFINVLILVVMDDALVQLLKTTSVWVLHLS